MHRRLHVGTCCSLLGVAFSGAAQASDVEAAVYDAAAPSVVVVFATDEQMTWVSQGSGFFVTDTVIATNFHVIEGAAVAAIRTLDGRACEVTDVVAANEELDLVTLEVEAACATRPLPLDTSARIGTDVVVIGAPQGLQYTLSKGIVSGLRNDGTRDLVQIDAAISQGSSGGPILNTRGEVIVVATFYQASGQNLNFGVAVAHLAPMFGGRQPVSSATTMDPSVDRGSLAVQAHRLAEQLIEEGAYSRALAVLLPYEEELTEAQRSTWLAAVDGYVQGQADAIVRTYLERSPDLSATEQMRALEDAIADIRDLRTTFPETRIGAYLADRADRLSGTLDAIRADYYANMAPPAELPAAEIRLERRMDKEVRTRLAARYGLLLHQIDVYGGAELEAWNQLGGGVFGVLGASLLMPPPSFDGQLAAPNPPYLLPFSLGLGQRSERPYLSSLFAFELTGAPYWFPRERRAEWELGVRLRVGADWMVHRSVGLTVDAGAGATYADWWQDVPAELHPIGFAGRLSVGVVALP